MKRITYPIFNFFVLILIVVCPFQNLSGQNNPIKLDTVYMSYKKGLTLKFTPRYEYYKTFIMKFFMASSGFDGPFKRRDNGKTKLYMTCEQALENIKTLDNITLGMPKIVYLVGWQYNGHDSKYPAFFEGNEAIKRPQDKNALESIKWLMREAKKYHTTVSLHINMFDAYEDSPLFDEYAAKNILARNKDGSLMGSEWGYKVDYAQEWKLGYSQKRIDKLCEILPIQEAGTIHIDAFHSSSPLPYQKCDGSWYVCTKEGSKINPYLNFSYNDEIKAQMNIVKYFISKGIDVTTEGITPPLAGYLPMAYWFYPGENYWRWPVDFYCGGMDTSEWALLFGTNFNVEQILSNDPGNFEEIKSHFCLYTIVWYYLNSLKRIYSLEGKNYKAVYFSGDVLSELKGDQYYLKKGKTLLMGNNNLVIPALWMGSNYLVAYSKDGYKRKSWFLSKDFLASGNVFLFEVTPSGKKALGTKKIKQGKLVLSLKPNEMILIQRN
jgi:hypothetical protein